MAQLALEAEAAGSYKCQAGFGTDIGGGRENQDDGFIWTKPAAGLVVLGILDGHGREVGKTAAIAAKARILSLLDAEYEQLLASPVDFLVRAHEVAHAHIKEVFAAEFEKQGYQVKATEDGYLLKRRSGFDNWSCVHGGAACTLVALIRDSLYISNVGDSTAILCAPRPMLSKSALQLERDAACTPSGVAPLICHPSALAPAAPESMLVLTAEHSPESSAEFERLRRFRCREGDPSQPALYVVYDSASHDKSQCAAVFEDTSSLVASQRGSYFKNVRKEWASLVSTPSSAAFQDALAFTRSLGDLHLHAYGVTHLPEVHRIDLPRSLAAGELLCVVAATDGVWDNWLYEDVAKFVMDGSCIKAVLGGAEGAQRVTASLVHRNAVYSKRNFGNQADNATAIVLYLSASPAFPNGSS